MPTMKKYDNGGSVLVDSEGRPVRFGYESDEEYEKRARPIMTALQMNDVSPSRAAPSKTRGFLSRLFNKPFKEYEEFDNKARAAEVEAEKARAEVEKAYAEAEKKRGAGARPFTRSIRTPEIDSSRFAKGGKVSSASKRADGVAQRGKTRGRYI